MESLSHGNLFEKWWLFSNETYAFTRNVVQWLSFCLTLPNIFINIFFLYSLFTTEELRITSFYPVGVQTFVAILVELSNAIVLTWRIAFDFDVYRSKYSHQSELSKTLREVLSGWGEAGVSCTAMFVRRNLMNYTLGVTSLAVAVERYLAVCQPFVYKTFVKENWNKRQCAILTLLILLPVSLAGVVKIVKHVHADSSFGDLTCAVVIQEPETVEHWVSFLLYFVTPACVCGALHYNTVKGLSEMKSNQSQNKALIRTIIITWLAWIVLWLPDFVIATIFAFEAERGTIMFVLIPITFAVKSLYTQIGPVLIIATYRPFRDRSQLILNTIRNCLMSPSDGSSKSARNSLNNRSENDQQVSPEQSIQRSGNKIKLLFPLLFVVSFLVLGLTLSIHYVILPSSSRFSEVAKQHRMVSNKLISSRQNLFDAMNAFKLDPRIHCSEARGNLNWRFKRCLLLRNDNIERDFSEQKQDCKLHDTTLAYPRSMSEASSIREFYLSKLEEHAQCSSLDVPLPLGFDSSTYASTLKSVDGKFYIWTDSPNERILVNGSWTQSLTGQPIHLDIPTDSIRLVHHLKYSLDLLCYPSKGSPFHFCSHEATRFCHVCFKEI